PTEPNYVFSEFSDIPIPESSMMDLNKTEIYGKDTEWVGKLVFESPYDSIGLYDFFKTELPKFNWIEVATTHGVSPVLVYGRYPRILLIKIEPERFEGSVVTMTMTPSPKRQDKMKKTNITTTTDTNTKIETMPITQSSIFVSPDAQKQVAGSLGLGEASNINYKSNSNGVGAPPRN
ncbi:hypothetical protein HDR59_02935, partial [bacterium]|nr:hypothetical protein [bacterium]